MNWIWLSFFALVSHPLLDCFTTYGTQILWPFYTTPIAWNVIFIIDPLYSFPLFLSLLFAYRHRRNPELRRRWACIGLLISSLYLLVCGISKFQANRVIEAHLHTQGLGGKTWVSLPTPFNAILWRGLAQDEERVYECYYSHFSSAPSLPESIPKNPYQREELGGHPQLSALKRFSKGYYSLYQRENHIYFADVRFGQKDLYIFAYRVGEVTDTAIQIEDITRAPRPQLGWSHLIQLLDRLRGNHPIAIP